MQEIIINDKSLDLKIFINGIPKYDEINKEALDNFVAILEMKITEHKENIKKSNRKCLI